MDNFWLTIAGIIGSVGSSGLIIFALSSWLGKIWANRIMESEKNKYAHDLEELKFKLQADNAKDLCQLKNQLETLQSKHLSAHQDKIATYRVATDIISELLANFDKFYSGNASPAEFPSVHHQFNLGRMRVYGYLAMLAPQNVMDAFDKLVDELISILSGSTYDWKKIRVLILACLNEIRIDLKIDVTPIKYNGSL